MPNQDRTKEFRSCVDSIRTRSAQPARNVEKQRLLAQRKQNTSEFTRMAEEIAKDISSTSLRLTKLGQRALSCFARAFAMFINAPIVAKRKTLFDDRPVEISVRGSMVHVRTHDLTL
jgi:syntaxin 5